MVLSACARRRGGFTLLEILIVILIVAIIAMIVIPRLISANRRAKEAQLLGDLKHLRDAVERFEANTGAWPPALTDIIAANGAAISADLDGGGGFVDRSAYDGPYMVSAAGAPLPRDPFTTLADWDYNNVTGALHSHSALTGMNGAAYNVW